MAQFIVGDVCEVTEVPRDSAFTLGSVVVVERSTSEPLCLLVEGTGECSYSNSRRFGLHRCAYIPERMLRLIDRVE
jgi:hypothetical protein